MVAVAGISRKAYWGVVLLLIVLIFDMMTPEIAEARRGRGRGLRRGGAGRVQQRRRRRGGRRIVRNNDINQIAALQANNNQVIPIFNDFNGNAFNPFLNNQFNQFGFNPFVNNDFSNINNGFFNLQAGNLNGFNQFNGLNQFNNPFNQNQFGQFGIVPLSQNLGRLSDGRIVELNAGSVDQNGQIVNPQNAVRQVVANIPESGQLIAGEKSQVRAETLSDIKAYNAGEKMTPVSLREGQAASDVRPTGPDNVVSLRR